MMEPFFESSEKPIIKDFLEKGYRIFPCEEPESLDRLKENIFRWAVDVLHLKAAPSQGEFFDQAHAFISPADLNSFRVKLISWLSKNPSVCQTLYRNARQALEIIVGNELAMQRSANLSIQLPADASSLLPVHSDVWSGNSPYEMVCWTPLVDCYKTKSMFLLSQEKSKRIYENFTEVSRWSAEKLFQSIKNDVEWLEVPYGHFVLFSHALIHGNRVNDETTTRWTFNHRFKSLLSPYGSKSIGETFVPITLRPATRIGMEYEEPTMHTVSHE